MRFACRITKAILFCPFDIGDLYKGVGMKSLFERERTCCDSLSDRVLQLQRIHGLSLSYEF